MRCIVLIRSHELLQEGWRKRSFGPAGPLLENRVKVAGVRFDETYHPVQVLRCIGGGGDPPTASGFNYGADVPTAGYVPGSTAPTHGTMVAYDVRIAAPDAQILDYALLRSQAGTWAAFLSDAIAAFADLVERVNAAPGRWVVNNSWGLFDRASDAPIGSPENYSANPDHPFNQITGALVAAGADVFFAAGNCGADCPDQRCGAGDTGPGASIHGANSHPDVFTVAAVTVTDRRLGYSSQGPGALHSRKPDLAGLSHFAGSGIYPADGGTSTASPVAAGVAAALRQRFATDHVATELAVDRDWAVIRVHGDPNAVEQGADRRHVDPFAGSVHLDDVAGCGGHLAEETVTASTKNG